MPQSAAHGDREAARALAQLLGALFRTGEIHPDRLRYRLAVAKSANSMNGCALRRLALVAALILAGCRSRSVGAATESTSSAFTVCSGQTYALCAVASCFVLNGLAYCKCAVMSGDSISLSDAFGSGQNICSVNTEGAENGYMASTFSLPDSVVAPGGNQALYSCPANTSTGAYAQCDGALCFTSTEGQSFPGFNEPLTDGEIICSCPITMANPTTTSVGYQIAGPYPCQNSFFQNCNRATASNKNGSQIYVGAPVGVAQLLTFKLYGSVPTLNQCLP